MRFNIRESIETDSEGNPLSPEQIEFFKNSKIRDRQGRLLVCYHGSNAKFDRFDKSKVTDGSFGRGFYFTTNEYEASEYGSNIAKVYLNIANLYYIGDEDCDERLLAYLEQQGVEFDMGDAKREAGNNIIEYFDFEQFVTDAIIELGYDGIQPFSDMFIAFEPNQIKSITNKTPTNSDNINEESLNKGLKEDMELNFDRALLDKWIDDLNANGAKYHQTFSYTEGGKYIRVSYTFGGRYDTAVFAFVDADGNIYKPAGWKTPAKGVRARIDQNPPMDEKDLYSARYRAAVYGESVKEDEQRGRKKVYEGISDADFEDIIAQFDNRGIDYSDAAYDTHIIWFKDDKEFEKAKAVLDRFRYKYVDGVNKRGTKYFELKEDWWDGGDSYFSHEQLMEFGSEFEEALQARHGKMFEVGGVFFEPNNMLVVSITVNPYGDDFFVEKKIDMRRVKTTKDLNKYIPVLLDDATKQIVDDNY